MSDVIKVTSVHRPLERDNWSHRLQTETRILMGSDSLDPETWRAPLFTQQELGSFAIYGSRVAAGVRKDLLSSAPTFNRTLEATIKAVFPRKNDNLLVAALEQNDALAAEREAAMRILTDCGLRALSEREFLFTAFLGKVPSDQRGQAIATLAAEIMPQEISLMPADIKLVDESRTRQLNRMGIR